MSQIGEKKFPITMLLGGLSVKSKIINDFLLYLVTLYNFSSYLHQMKSTNSIDKEYMDIYIYIYIYCVKADHR